MNRLLGFSDVDGLGFAALRGRLASCADILDLCACDLGPFMEYALLAAAKTLPRPDTSPWLKLNGMSDLYNAMKQRRASWICPATRQLGLFRTAERLPQDETPWLQFRLAAQNAANANGFARQTAAQFAGALGELHSNIYEHSHVPRTGLIAFKASSERFEFVVADWGIGVLASLKECQEYTALNDHGEALQLALTDGVSRFGPGSGHGYGFHDLFTGLANLNGSLRFRSGNFALTVEGEDPKSIPWMLREKVPIRGFLASVACRPF